MRSSGAKKRDLLGQPLRVGRVGGEDRGRRLARPRAAWREAGEQQGVGRAGRAGQGEALAGGDVGELHEGAECGACEKGRDFTDRPPLMLAGPAGPQADADFRSARPPLLCARALCRHRAPAPERRCRSSTSRSTARRWSRTRWRRSPAWPRLELVLVVLAPDDEEFERRVDLPAGKRFAVARCGGARARRDRGRGPRRAR